MKIHELTLLTNNLTETKEFYKDKIGFELIEETESGILFAAGNSNLIFEQTDKLYSPNYHFAFLIPGNKTDEALNWLSQRVELIGSEDAYITNFENWSARAIYFHDNNQNILEFIARADLNIETDKPFSAETILNLNEIGIVADEPLKTAEQLIQQTGTKFFAKGPKREDFVALGNEEGLFVISRPDRNWYPTQKAAEKWKVKAKVNVAGNEYELDFN